MNLWLGVPRGWRSLIACLFQEQKVEGSNPGTLDIEGVFPSFFLCCALAQIME